MSGLTTQQLASLEALAGSPAAKALLAEQEADRAQQRAQILAQLTVDDKAARADAEAAAAVVRERLAEVDRLKAALAGAAALWREADREASIAAERVERLQNQATLALRGLGDDRIDLTLCRVLTATAATRGAMVWQEHRDAYGNVVGTSITDPALLERYTRLQELASELEGMRRAPATPAEIEGRCVAIDEWLEAGMPPPRGTVGARVEGLRVFARVWQRLAPGV